MADASRPNPSDWDGPILREPDPQAVGPAMMAWYALHGALHGGPAEAADTVAWAADVVAVKLGAFGSGVANPISASQASIAIREAQLLLGYVAEIFGRWRVPHEGDVTFPFKAELKRQRGRPGQTEILPRSLAWWGVAMEVEALMAAGEMQKFAVGKVAKRLGLKDAIVAGWCRERRKSLQQQKDGFGNM